jgi:hypothetical protein
MTEGNEAGVLDTLAERLSAWIDDRYGFHQLDERSEARERGDKLAASCATEAMLELWELRSWLNAQTQNGGQM